MRAKAKAKLTGLQILKKETAPLWAAIPKRRRMSVGDLLIFFSGNALDGRYGGIQKDLLAGARKSFDAEFSGLPDIDWAMVLPLVLAYLPFLLDLLRHES